MNKKNLVAKSLIIVTLLFVSFFVSNALSVIIPDGGGGCSAGQCSDVNGGCINNGACGTWISNGMGYCNNGVWEGASCQCLGGGCPANCQAAGYAGSCGSCAGNPCIDGCSPTGQQWCYGTSTTPTGPCYSLTTGAQCIARSDCCWSDHWQICVGTGESCCHSIACNRGDPLCTACPNDALDCYVCQGNNVFKDICAGQTQYELCRGKASFDDCAYNKYCWGSTLYPLDKRCKCISCIDYIKDLILSPTLPNSVIQQGDGLTGYVVVQGTWNCKNIPIVYYEINENGCTIQDSATAGRYVCSGQWCGYEFSWTFPQIPTGCLGKTVNFKVRVEDSTISRSITLSSDPTRDEPPTLPYVGVWSPSPILPTDLITYTAHAEDDKGLLQIQILFANIKVSPNYGVVKTCSVSGTSADCTFTTSTPYPAGSQICMIGNALDTKSQQNTGYDMGARKDRNCITVCNSPTETDNGKDYYTKGNCTGPCKSPQTDFCPWEGPTGYCCNIFGDGWVPKNIATDGTVDCCHTTSLFASTCDQTKTINCKNILVENFVNGRDCSVEFYDCSGEGKTCQSGKCVSGSTTCIHANPTVTISPSSQTGSSGQSLTYTASIKNNDNSVCSASTFTLTNTCPSGFTCSLNKNSVSISPGSTDSSTTITVASPSSATSGTYSFGVTATSSSYTGTGSANYVIGGTSTCSDGTAYGSCSSTKPKYCSSGTLINKCSQCGCSSGICQADESCSISGGTTISLSPGWNMFSLSLNTTLTADYIRSQCGSTGTIWNYNPVSAAYVAVTQINPGIGYWINVNSVCTISVSGSSIQSIPGLKTGWNQVGTFSQTVLFNDVKGDCNVLSGPWKYNPASGQYDIATSLVPGYGYWVKVSSDCNLGSGGGNPPSYPTSTCSDGTAYGSCSSTKPSYCSSGTLINNCSQCGCGQGSCDQTTGNCVTTQTATFTVKGTVTNDRSQPLANAKVFISQSYVNKPTVTATTDSNGFYTTTAESAVDSSQRVYVSISASLNNNYFGDSTSGWYLPSGNVVTINMVLREKTVTAPAAHVIGKVVDVNNNPIVNAMVVITPYFSHTYGMYQLTDSQGNFGYDYISNYYYVTETLPTTASVQIAIRKGMYEYTPSTTLTKTVTYGSTTDIGTVKLQ